MHTAFVPNRWWPLFLCALGATVGPSGAAADVTRDLHRAVERIARDARDARDTADTGDAEKSADTGAAEQDTASAPEGTDTGDGQEGGAPFRPFAGGSKTSVRPLPAPTSDQGAGKTAVVVPVHDVIDMGVAALVERAIADHPDAAAIVLDINTPGGRIDAAIRIRDALLGVPARTRTVAFVHPRAISAGAFISLACDHIFMAPGGTIGAATPISLEGGKAEAVGEKYVSYFRAEMASTAKAKGRDGDMAAAMVDADVEIPGVVPKGKLLTMDTDMALAHHMADAQAASLDEVLAALALSAAAVERVSFNWGERLARVFTDPTLSGILMSIGMLGILIELYQPGFGLPGIVGIISLLIFFTGHLVVNLVGFEEIILFVLGSGLLVLEIFVIPGFGIAGIAGVVLMVLALALALVGVPLSVSWDLGLLGDALARTGYSLAAAVALGIAVLAMLPKSRFARSRLVLSAAVNATAQGGVEGEAVQHVAPVGARGTAATPLRPAGIAVFDGRRVDVTTEGPFVEAGKAVVVVRREGNHVVVREQE